MRGRAVEEEVVEEPALRREQRGVLRRRRPRGHVGRGRVPLRLGGGGAGGAVGEDVVGEERVEEARRLGPPEADDGAGRQAAGQHPRVRRRARVEEAAAARAAAREAAGERQHGEGGAGGDGDGRRWRGRCGGGLAVWVRGQI